MASPPRALDRLDELQRRFLSQPEMLRWVQAAFELVPVAMTLRAADQSMIWANEAYERLIGLSLGQLAGGSLADVLEDGETMLTKASRSEGSPIKFEQVRYQPPSSNSFYADVTVQALLDDNGEVAFYLGCVENVNDRVRLARRRALSDFRVETADRLSSATAGNLTEVLQDVMADIGRWFGAAHVALGGLDRRADTYGPTVAWTDEIADPAAYVDVPSVEAAMMVARGAVATSLSPIRSVGSMNVIACVLPSQQRVFVLVVSAAVNIGDSELQFLRDTAHAIASASERIEAQIYFKLAFDDAPLGISLRRMDSTLVAANMAYARFLGYDSPDEMIGAEADKVLAQDSASAATDIPSQVAAAGQVQFDRIDFTCRDGSTVTGRVHAKAVEFDMGEVLVLSHVEDLTASTENERQLKLSQRRFRDLVENSPAITMLTNVDLDITYVSPSISQTGWTSEQLVGTNFEELPRSVVGNLVVELNEVISTDRARFFDWAAQGPDGMQWLHVSAVPEHNNDGDVVGVILVAVDDTERRQSQALLAYQARHDPLTGLANRNALLAGLEARLADGVPSPALLFLDLDRFKVVNDSLGHAAGDKLLKVVADRLVSAVDDSSTVGRLGGDEFVIVVDGPVDDSELAIISQRIHESLAPPIVIGSDLLYATASIGITLAADGDAETIMANADSAMYQAKAEGRNRTSFFDPYRRPFPSARIGLEADLRQALPRGEFEVFYQPEFALPAKTLLGAEALVRWNHPQRGVLAAAEFIEIAEECGLISEIGDWVLTEACQVLRQWQHDAATAGLVMRVNLSGNQLSRTDSVARVTDIVHAAHVDPAKLCLELTETVLMADAASSLEVLEGLRSLGVILAIDDFGTGYSSLAYLKRFPVDVLKIDRSFVSGLPTDGNDLAIVQSIVSLAGALGLELVAEGVETNTQASALVDLHCYRAQGYLFGRPVALGHFTETHLRDR